MYDIGVMPKSGYAKLGHRYGDICYVPLVKQGILYISAGLITFGTDFSLYRLLLMFGIPVTLSKGMSFICALAISFNLNRIFVFKYRGADFRFHRFLILANVNLIINILINRFSLVVLGSDSINICFIIATGVTVMCSFLGLKLWVFKN